jgi:hypothetical protein
MFRVSPFGLAIYLTTAGASSLQPPQDSCIEVSSLTEDTSLIQFDTSLIQFRRRQIGSDGRLQAPLQETPLATHMSNQLLYARKCSSVILNASATVMNFSISKLYECLTKSSNLTPAEQNVCERLVTCVEEKAGGINAQFPTLASFDAAVRGKGQLRNSSEPTLAQSTASVHKGARRSSLASLFALRSDLRSRPNRSAYGATQSAMMAESSGFATHAMSLATSTSGIPLTPMGMALAVLMIFLTPPILYVTIGIVVICCCGCIISTFWDSLKDYVFALLDFIALLVRTVVKTCQFIFSVIQRLVYPIKESILSCTESVDQYCFPYKRRTPFQSANVASFRL